MVGIRKLGPYSSAVVLTSLSILQLVNVYNAYPPVNFSPRVYPEKRDELKPLIKSQPGTCPTPRPSPAIATRRTLAEGIRPRS